VVGPPAEEQDGAAEDEADESDKDPVASHLRGRKGQYTVLCTCVGGVGFGFLLTQKINCTSAACHELPR
jgi:hypothetical protein